jgi:hypothetical protein
MHTVSTHFTIADYCEAMKRGDILVNRDYQRSAKVWPSIARSFLIETIILGLPMPKIYLYQKVDVKSKKTFKEIVDGQQRSIAIRDFYDDSFRASGSLDSPQLASRLYSEMAEDDQKAFLDYQLSADLFISASDEEVRDVFRRMNSYTVPLNPEEKRHAVYQGPFKWFVHRLGRQYDKAFIRLGIFSENKIVRMADSKLITEVCHALLNGIQTTKEKQLDATYRDHDERFPMENEIKQRLTRSFDQLIEWDELHGGPLMAPHVVYSLVLALTHMHKAVPALDPLWRSDNQTVFDRSIVVGNLSMLAEAIESSTMSEATRDFVDGCSMKTNTAEQRVKRFRSICNALQPRSL